METKNINQQNQKVETQYNAGGDINLVGRKASRFEISKEITETELKLLQINDIIHALMDEWMDASQIRNYILGKTKDKSEETKRYAAEIKKEAKRKIEEKRILEEHLNLLKEELNSQS